MKDQTHFSSSRTIKNYGSSLEIKNLIKNLLSLNYQYNYPQIQEPILPNLENYRFLHTGFYCTRKHLRKFKWKCLKLLQKHLYIQLHLFQMKFSIVSIKVVIL